MEVDYQDIEIPYRRSEGEDPLGEALNAWEKAKDEWVAAALDAAKEEASLKAWEASRKKALIMGQKKSAVLAESILRSEPSYQGDEKEFIGMTDWEYRFITTQKASIEAEDKKRSMVIAQSRWETERTREATLRHVR